MKQIIYVDVLISVNLIVNYFLLVATAKFLYIKYSFLRIFLGSMLGALFSLYIFFPKTSMLLSTIIKFFMALIIIFVSFPMVSLKKFFKTVICFFLINFSFSGIIFAVWLAFSPRGLIIRNDVVYFGISPVILVISTIVAYTVFMAINKVCSNRDYKNNLFEIGFVFQGKDVKFTAKVDTGNMLRETFSNLPVIVVKKSRFEEYFGKFILEFNNFYSVINLSSKVKFRVIPYRTVLGDGLLPAFKPDYVYFFVKNRKVKKEAYIAISENFEKESGFDALVNKELFI